MEPNIYEPPKTDVTNAAGLPMNMASYGSCFTDAGILYIRKGFESPPVCIKSGEPVEVSSKKFKTSASYLNPFAYLLIFIGLIGWIIIVVLQKNMRFKVYLAAEHARKFKRNKLISLLSFFISIAFLISSIPLENAILAIGGVIVLLFSIFWAFSTNKLFKVIRYKDNFFQLANAHPNYLKHIPKSSTPSTSFQMGHFAEAEAPVMKVHT